MKIMNRIISILIVLLMLLNTGTVFAATDSESYDAGYDAGYDYGRERRNTSISASTAYNRFKKTDDYTVIKDEIKTYKENDFREGFKDGYEDGHGDDGIDKDKKEQVDYAKTLGKALGEIYGARHFQNGEDADYKDVIPTRSNIINMYDLKKQSTAYVNSFVIAFNNAFVEGYIEAYDKAMFEPDKITMEQGVSDGEETGAKLGAAYGVKDFYEGKDLYFQRDLLTATEIRSKYSLNNDKDEYEDGFISGFTRAYEEAYNAAFREANMSEALVKVTSQVVPISGASVVTADNRFAVKILPGTYYHDVNLNITTTFDAGNYNSGSFIKSSDSYTVEIGNSSGNIDNNKLIELSFEYYGDKIDGGIYRQGNGEWLYVPTVIKDGVMSAKINPESLKYGTTFSAFVDKNTKVFRDARGHWASDEIDAYVKRGVISGYSDNTFKPDNSISRAEFLTLLSRVFNWNSSWYLVSSTSYKDSGTFGGFTDVINYATYFNYIYGYSDGTFKPGNPISYAEVETIMKRVMSSDSFRWSYIANNMLYDKKERSNSFNGMNNRITRAEVVYMLYSLTE